MFYLKWIHHIHGVLFFLLFFSGLLLYFSSTRTWFNQLGFPLVYFHLIVSVFYASVVFIRIRSIIHYMAKKPYIKKFNVTFNFTFFVFWLISGLLMYFQAYMPIVVRNAAVFIHDWSTFLFIPWVFIHVVGHLFHITLPWPNWWGRKAPLPLVIEENRLERREFVQFFVVSSLFVLIGGWIRWFIPTFETTENKRRGYFRIYNITDNYPRYKDKDWSLTIDGLVNEPITLTMEDLHKVRWTTIVDDFHCVTGWSVLGVEMKGIKITDLFETYGIESQSDYVTAYSGDQIYFDSFTTTQLFDEESILVFEFDGQPLKHVQGYPCRLFHPEMYAYKSVKWLDRLEFTEVRTTGYWQESGGYDLNGYL